ncbi:MAG: WG repeat-containing protein, partial [Saprospiraceae bacterium]|nr:WG repeat-containing protein [Saprospiraceae bacterium]
MPKHCYPLLFCLVLCCAQIMAQDKDSCYTSLFNAGARLYQQGEQQRLRGMTREAQSSYDGAFDRFVWAFSCLDKPDEHQLAEWIQKTKLARERLMEAALAKERQARATADSLLRELQEEEAVNRKIVEASYFYGGRFALAFDGRRYGYIDKLGEPSIPFDYETATPFDATTGFARVSRGGARFLLDTFRREYRLAEDLHQLGPDIRAVDLSHKNLAFFPEELLRYKDSLQILFLQGNRMTRLPAEIGGMRRLQWLDVRDNPLIGLPAEVGQVSGLRILKSGELPLGAYALKPDFAGKVVVPLRPLPFRVFERPLNSFKERELGDIPYIDINSLLRVELIGSDMLKQQAEQNEGLRVVVRFRDLEVHNRRVLSELQLVLAAIDSARLEVQSEPEEGLANPLVRHFRGIPSARLQSFFSIKNLVDKENLRHFGDFEDASYRTEFMLNSLFKDMQEHFRNLGDDRNSLLAATHREIHLSAQLIHSGGVASPIPVTDRAQSPGSSFPLYLLPAADRSKVEALDSLAKQISSQAQALLNALEQLPRPNNAAEHGVTALLRNYLSGTVETAGQLAALPRDTIALPNFYIDLAQAGERKRLDHIVIQSEIKGPGLEGLMLFMADRSALPGEKPRPAMAVETRRYTLTQAQPHMS